jgi:hypothetical protein
MSRFAGVAGWVVAAILLAVLLWPKGSPVDGNSGALRAENDSLRAVIAERDYREQLIFDVADSLRHRLDSLVKNEPSPEVRYISWHNALRTWSTDSIWRYLGTMPTDTGSGPAGYPAALGGGQGDH